jgi:hypothetical protein
MALLAVNGGPGNIGFSTTLSPTGTAAGDQAAMNQALSTLAGSGRSPFGASAQYATGIIMVNPGTYFFTTTTLLQASQKIQGLRIIGSGSQVTSFDYNPSSSQPMFVNQEWLNVKFQGIAVNSHDPTSDFIWLQEEGGLTNIQDYLDEDMTYTNFRRIKRMTGGNNNSEHKILNCFASGMAGPWIYTPPTANCSISPGQNVTISNPNADVQIGDSGVFSASVAPMTASTTYYVVAAGSTTFQVSATRGGSAITFTGSGTPNFTNASDQFLNFAFEGLTKFWSATGPMIVLNFGGQVTINHLDASAYTPTSPCTFVGSCSGTTLTVASVTTGALQIGQLLEVATGGTPFLPGTVITAGSGTSWTVNLSQTIPAATNFQVVVPLFQLLNGIHAGGVEVFRADQVRVEYKNDVGRLSYSQWLSGNWSMRVDESSQASSRNATNYNCVFDLTNNTGPTISFNDCQLAGQHGYVYNVNNFNFTQSIRYTSTIILNQPDVANFMVGTGSNTGGIPVAEFEGTSVRTSASGTFKQVLDCSWNWYLNAGAQTKRRSANMLGAQSNLPISSTTTAGYRFPRNTVGVATNFLKIANSNTGAYSYQINAGDGTVLATFSGSNAGAAFAQSVALNVLFTDANRTVTITDLTGRAGVFNGVVCDLEYKG